MNYHKIEECNIGNGNGFRTILWISGCNHHCLHCQNPETWNHEYGKKFTKREYNKIIESINKPYIDGITLSGGDPLSELNREEVTSLCRKLKKDFPNKTIWLYTGFTYEEIKDLKILKYIDILVDGPFIFEERDISLAFRGSKNQRIINIKKTIEKGEIVLYEENA